MCLRLNSELSYQHRRKPVGRYTDPCWVRRSPIRLIKSLQFLTRHLLNFPALFNQCDTSDLIYFAVCNDQVGWCGLSWFTTEVGEMSKSELLDIYAEKNSSSSSSSSDGAGSAIQQQQQQQHHQHHQHHQHQQHQQQQEKRLFTCSLCPYRTDRRNNLKRHTATMHEQSAAILECCGTRFANKAALRHHTAAYHRHGYICTICGRVFCRRALLRRHHAVHSGFKEFTCALCDYATSHKSNLERHMKIHEGVHGVTSSSHLKAQKHGGVDDVYHIHHGHRIHGDASDVNDGHEHNPILASLLSQPGHNDMLQWSYHPPYDYSSQPPAPNIKSERRWSYESTDADYPAHFFSASCRKSETTANLPLRHAIDVILGVKEEPASPEEPCVVTGVTTASNHWSVGHVSCTVVGHHDAGDVLVYSGDADSGVESDRSSVGYKHHYGDADVDDITDAQCALQHDATDIYVPKKLRMSKRYQSLLKCWTCFLPPPTSLRLSFQRCQPLRRSTTARICLHCSFLLAFPPSPLLFPKFGPNFVLVPFLLLLLHFLSFYATLRNWLSAWYIRTPCEKIVSLPPPPSPPV